MPKLMTILFATLFTLSLSGCWLLFGAAAGAGGGYVYKQEEDKKDAP